MTNEAAEEGETMNLLGAIVLLAFGAAGFVAQSTAEGAEQLGWMVLATAALLAGLTLFGRALAALARKLRRLRERATLRGDGTSQTEPYWRAP